MRLLALVTPLLLLGCAENAILELDFILPEDATGELHVHPLSTDSVITFEDATQMGLRQVEVVPLGPGAEPPHISLLAREPEISQNLYIGVSVCAELPTPCLPTRVFQVERAFYLGAYTHLDIDLRGEPLEGTDVEAISICEVEGCGRSEGNYCYDTPSGPRHFCDR